MMIKEGSIKSVIFMTLRAVVLVLGFCRKYQIANLHFVLNHLYSGEQWYSDSEQEKFNQNW